MWDVRPLLLGAALAVAAGACSEDVIITRCSEKSDALRVDEVSTLENGVRWFELVDAPTIEAPLEEGAEIPLGRRVKTVEVLLLQPQDEAQRVASPTLTVRVLPGRDPRGVRGWALTQVADEDALEWSDVVLDNPQSTTTRQFRAAWWTFDFTELIPDDEAVEEAYVVAVAWYDEANAAIVGYSNFNLSCQGLWGIYPASYGLPKPGGGIYTSSDGWIDVSDGGQSCSYPMLRVEIEDLFERKKC